MDLIRTQYDRVAKAFQKLLIAPGPDGSWTIHEANLAAYSALTQSSSKTTPRPALPPEIVLHILDHPDRSILTSYIYAEYPNEAPLRVPSLRSPFTFLSLSLPSAKAVRKVIFEIKGKDQGWSSYSSDHRTFNNTWSWFDAVIRGTEMGEDRKFEEFSKFELQRNRHAGQGPEVYRIEFGEDSHLVRSLEENKRIDLDACAAFAGWECQVYEARIEIWSVDDLTLTDRMEWVEQQDKEIRTGRWVDKEIADEMRVDLEEP